METVLQVDSPCCYCEVTPGIRDWIYDDERPEKETVVVTAHGLRRLLRATHASLGVVFAAFHGGDDEFDERLERENLVPLMKELCTMWCEDEIVMSRLFVDDEGRAIRHQDDDVDAAGIPPWERDAEGVDPDAEDQT